MSDAPIWAPDPAGTDSALIEAARAFEASDYPRAAALWRALALPRISEEWPSPLAAAVAASLAAVLDRLDGETAAAEASGREAAASWRLIEPWLADTALPFAGGRSTPAHFRKQRRDPDVYRTVARREHVRLVGAAAAVALNNLGEALAALGRVTEAVSFYREAVTLRGEAFGGREAGLGTILENLAAAERQAGLDAGASEAALAIVERDPVPSGVERYLSLASAEPKLRRRLLAAAELVPILRRAAG
ncbi:MAG: tetratricopeptide repeat protein [Rhodospirillales bacterium]|nr:tetratricopeptide repeat protein [Rhodospirillales bacterium]